MDFYTLHIKVLLSDKEGLLSIINQGAELNRLDLIGNSPLHLAVLCNDITVVNMLLKAGANPNVTSREGLTPTQKAVQLGYSAIKYMLVSFGGHVSSNNLNQVSKSALYN